MRWGLAIQELDLTIQYRSGKNNQSTGTLSRMPIQVQDQDKVTAMMRETTVYSLACDHGGVGSHQDKDPTQT